MRPRRAAALRIRAGLVENRATRRHGADRIRQMERAEENTHHNIVKTRKWRYSWIPRQGKLGSAAGRRRRPRRQWRRQRQGTNEQTEPDGEEKLRNKTVDKALKSWKTAKSPISHLNDFNGLQAEKRNEKFRMRNVSFRMRNFGREFRLRAPPLPLARERRGERLRQNGGLLYPNISAAIAAKGSATTGRKSILASTSVATSTPGATSTSVTPSGVRRKAARSVMYQTSCPRFSA